MDLHETLADSKTLALVKAKLGSLPLRWYGSTLFIGPSGLYPARDLEILYAQMYVRLLPTIFMFQYPTVTA